MANRQNTILSSSGPFNRLLICTLAVFLRVLAYIYCIDFLKKRPELNVPQNSFRRLIDGIYMLRDGVSPYDGDMIHCSFDVVTSEILRLVAVVQLKNQGSSAENIERIADLVSKCYMLNPVAVASCAILSLSVVCNLITALFILAFVKGSLLLSSILYSVLVHLSLYPAVYICALLVKFSTLKERMLTITFSTIMLIGLLFFNRFLNENSWDYIDSTYKFLLDVRDLTPNVGIFWYFFIEVFNHFRRFFLWVFQINILVYLVPLSLTLRSNAFLLLYQLMILISVFASYPSMAESLIYLSLLPLFEHLRKYFRWKLIIGGALSATIVLAPVMWQMWIVTGSGNANFYFAVTLTYSVAQIFLLTDLLYGYLRLKLVEGRGITDESKIAILVFK
ncbi:unnamed protein product [Acanthocheilonema viteae]|uniref:GPI transamidase subunit PIG-U n=1 Tax=Acanthocheilonema viteae TaxID=6277 RepID=A0A498SK53_ACAVI|nr:unnamed protein product [Acanthocheilonema viteae]